MKFKSMSSGHLKIFTSYVTRAHISHLHMNLALALCLFRWKILYKDSFPCFSVFDSIKKYESIENYLWSTEKV